MTESVVTPEILKTALAASMEKTGMAAPLVSYQGALSPEHLDVPERETAALLWGVAVHDLGWMRRVVVRGEDRFRWLSGMVTNAIETLAAESGAYNLVLNAQGRIQGDCVVWRGLGGHDGLEIESTAAQMDALLTHFDRFIIMDDVELTPVTGVAAVGLSGPGAKGLLERLGLPFPDVPLTSAAGVAAVGGREIGVQVCRGFGEVVPRFALWVETDRIGDLWKELSIAGATPVGAQALEVLRVVEGAAAYGVDIQSRDLAQETSLDRALSFTKGCYLGQEIVERVRSRGQVHRHLRHLELIGDGKSVAGENSIALPAVGIELRIAGSGPESKAAGTITSVAEVRFGDRRRVFAIGMIRAEAEVGSLSLVYEGGVARILSSTPKF